MITLKVISKSVVVAWYLELVNKEKMYADNYIVLEQAMTTLNVEETSVICRIEEETGLAIIKGMLPCPYSPNCIS
jgi:hypothetical protein